MTRTREQILFFFFFVFLVAFLGGLFFFNFSIVVVLLFCFVLVVGPYKAFLCLLALTSMGEMWSD